VLNRNGPSYHGTECARLHTFFHQTTPPGRTLDLTIVSFENPRTAVAVTASTGTAGGDLLTVRPISDIGMERLVFRPNLHIGGKGGFMGRFAQNLLVELSRKSQPMRVVQQDGNFAQLRDDTGGRTVFVCINQLTRRLTHNLSLEGAVLEKEKEKEKQVLQVRRARLRARGYRRRLLRVCRVLL
jgi:hypothetical protein